MPRSIRDYLQHVLDETDYLTSSMEQLDGDSFLQDETRKRAFVRSKRSLEKRLSRYLMIYADSIRRLNGARLQGCATV